MCAHNTHNTVLSSGSEGWPWTRNVIFVNVTMARERTQAWLALLPPPVPGSHSHSFPQPHCASLGAGQDCHPESTKQHGVLHHILAADVKALGSRHAAELLSGGGLDVPHPSRQGLGSSNAGELAPAPQLARKCREVLAQIYQLSREPGRNDEQVPPTVSGHGWRWGLAPMEGQQEPTCLPCWAQPG